MAAATPKTPSDAQPTSENITYEATLNAAASASRFPAGAFLDYAGLKKILEALAEMYATGDRAAEGLAYASLATTGRDAAAAVKRAPSSFQVSSHEAFLEKLDGELAKCDDFAHREVVKVISATQRSAARFGTPFSEALRRLGYYARRVNSPLSVPNAP